MFIHAIQIILETMSKLYLSITQIHQPNPSYIQASPKYINQIQVILMHYPMALKLYPISNRTLPLKTLPSIHY